MRNHCSLRRNLREDPAALLRFKRLCHDLSALVLKSESRQDSILHLDGFLQLLFPAAKPQLIASVILRLRHRRTKEERGHELTRGQEEELREMFEMLDRDGSGFIDCEEIVALASNNVRTGIDADEMRDLFAVFDTRGGGFIGVCKALAHRCAGRGEGFS